MADENFRPRRAPQPEDQGNEALNMAQQVRQQAQSDEADGSSDQPASATNGNYQIAGSIPPAFQQALNNAKNQNAKVEQNLSGNPPKRGFSQMSRSGEATAPTFTNTPKNDLSSSGHLKELLDNLRGSTTVYEEIQLPSKGKFYDDTDGPSNGILSIRPMTGEEEQILATPRFVRKGQAINMIFQKCVKEKYKLDELLTVDRTYLLIYLRGISYSPEYDVEIKCPECEKKFSTTIDLNSLYVEECPDDFGPDLQDVLPTTNLPFSYRLSNGKD